MKKNAYGNSPKGNAGTNPPLAAADAGLQVIWDFLTCWKCDGGETRLTGSLTIFTEDGALKVCFNDRDSGSLAFRTIETLTGAFKACDELLKANRLDWRQAKEGRAKR